jgi:tetratricopeptide (TPR) repeat protein
MFGLIRILGDPGDTPLLITALLTVVLPPVGCLVALRFLLWPGLVLPAIVTCVAVSTLPFCLTLAAFAGESVGGAARYEPPIYGRLFIPSIIILAGCEASIALWKTHATFVPHLESAASPRSATRHPRFQIGHAPRFLATLCITAISFGYLLMMPALVVVRGYVNGKAAASTSGSNQPRRVSEVEDEESAAGELEMGVALEETRPDEAVLHIGKALQRYQDVAARHRDLPIFRLLAARCRFELGVIATNHGNYADGQKSLKLALDDLYQIGGGTGIKDYGILLNRCRAALASTLISRTDGGAGDLSSAEQLAEAVVRDDPGDSGSRELLGIIYSRQHRYKAAIASFETMIRLDGGQVSPTWFYLAEAYARNGDRERARKYFDEAARWVGTNCPDEPQVRAIQTRVSEILKSSD